MQLDEVLERLRAEGGAVRVEVMPDDLCRRIVEEESTVEAVDGMLPVKNSGLDDYMDRNTRLVVFDDGSLYRPDCATMNMCDGTGAVIGHDILLEDADLYKGRDDVMFISDDFIMYTDKEIDGGSYMDMLGTPYRGTGRWVPEGSRCIIWFSSSTSSDMICEYFGQPKENLATALIGLDL